MIFDYHMGNLMRKQLSMIVRLSFLTALLSFVSSCSIPTFTKSSESNTSDERSTVTSIETRTSESMTSDQHTSTDLLKQYADEYMSVLISGDMETTCAKFSLSKKEMLPPTYSNDEEIYHLLYANMTYSLGYTVRRSQQEYELSVTCYFPDLQECVKAVRQDETFMYEWSEPWVIAFVNSDHTQLSTSYDAMNEAVLKEAMRRIEAGEYTQRAMLTSSFEFHQNFDDWNCTKYPDFINFMSQDMYMERLGTMQTSEALDLIENFGPKFVQDGKIQDSDYQTAVENLKILINEAQP